MSKKKYYHNNWAAIKDAPAELFDTLSFEELMDWKVCGYELPSSVACMIRETDLETGKIREWVYNKEGAAKRRARKIMDAGNEFIVCTPEAVHYIYPQEDYDDPLA